MTHISLEERLRHEREHARTILDAHESNWGWHTPAGKIRKQRRADFLSTGYLNLPVNPRVLEVGCGSGTFTGELSNVFQDLLSIDIADDMIAAAKQRFPGVKFEIRDIHKTGFPGDHFDLVVGCSVLHHLEWEDALKEIRRILKPGGQLRFSEPNLLNPQIYLQKNWGWLKKRVGDSPDEYAFTAGRISSCLAAAGFTDFKAQAYEFLHPSTPAFLIGAVQGFERMLEWTPLGRIGGSLKIEARK